MLPRVKPIARGAGASAQVALCGCEIVPTFGYAVAQLLATVKPKLVTVSSTLNRLSSRSGLWEPGAGLAEFTS